MAVAAEGATLLFAYVDREGRPGQARFIDMVAARWPTQHAWVDLGALPPPYQIDKFRILRIDL